MAGVARVASTAASSGERGRRGSNSRNATRVVRTLALAVNSSTDASSALSAPDPAYGSAEPVADPGAASASIGTYTAPSEKQISSDGGEYAGPSRDEDASVEPTASPQGSIALGACRK